MYGFVIENILAYLRSITNAEKFDAIIQSTKLPLDAPLEINRVYPESYIPRIVRKACRVLDRNDEEIYYEVTFY